MRKVVKRIFIAYCIVIGTAFGIGYMLVGLGSLNLIPPPPTDWKDK
jgi:hypothetical protein